MTDLVRFEDKAKPLGKGSHLGGGDHHLPRARRDDDVSVVDEAAGSGAAEVTQRLGQERLALKAREARIDLEEDHARVAEHDGCDLHPGGLTADRGQMRGGVVLHLLTGGELVVSGGWRRG